MGAVEHIDAISSIASDHVGAAVLSAPNLYSDPAYNQVFGRNSDRGQDLASQLPHGQELLQEINRRAREQPGLSLDRLSRLAQKNPDNQFIQSLVDNFQQLDADHSGRLSMKELQDGVRSKGEKILADANINGASPQQFIEYDQQLTQAMSSLHITADPKLEGVSDLLSKQSQVDQWFCQTYPAEANIPTKGEPSYWAGTLVDSQREKFNQGGLTQDDLKTLGETYYLKDGTKDYAEFVKWATQPNQWKSLDSDGSGTLDANEERMALAAYYQATGKIVA